MTRTSRSAGLAPVRAYAAGFLLLGLVLALAHRPRLLVLDEPTASLDPLMQELLYVHLRAAAAEGRTVFLSSHTLSEVEQLCSRVAILREGSAHPAPGPEAELRAGDTLVVVGTPRGIEELAVLLRSG